MEWTWEREKISFNWNSDPVFVIVVIVVVRCQRALSAFSTLISLAKDRYRTNLSGRQKQITVSIYTVLLCAFCVLDSFTSFSTITSITFSVCAPLCVQLELCTMWNWYNILWCNYCLVLSFIRFLFFYALIPDLLPSLFSYSPFLDFFLFFCFFFYCENILWSQWQPLMYRSLNIDF